MFKQYKAMRKLAMVTRFNPDYRRIGKHLLKITSAVDFTVRKICEEDALVLLYYVVTSTDLLEIRSKNLELMSINPILSARFDGPMVQIALRWPR